MIIEHTLQGVTHSVIFPLSSSFSLFTDLSRGSFVGSIVASFVALLPFYSPSLAIGRNTGPFLCTPQQLGKKEYFLLYLLGSKSLDCYLLDPPAKFRHSYRTRIGWSCEKGKVPAAMQLLPLGFTIAVLTFPPSYMTLDLSLSRVTAGFLSSLLLLLLPFHISHDR